MSKKFNKSLNFNYLSSNVSFGSISASTFTGSNLSISGSISSVELYSNNITGGNIVGTTISAGTLLATLITGGNLSISGTVTAGNLLGSTINGTNSTITNAVHTALSTGTLNATTSVNSAVVNATTRVSSANLNSSAITTGTIYITSSDTWQTGLNITNNNNNTWQLNVGGSTNNAVGINNIGLFNGTYRMVVTSTGNIGIGTGTPESKLHVNGAITIEGETVPSAGGTTIDSSNLNQTYITFKPNGSSNDWAYLRQIGSSNNSLMALDIHDDGDEPGFCIRSITSTANPDTVNERFRVQANGNVGIGNSSPSEALHVEGNILIKTGGSLWITGNSDNALNRLRFHNTGSSSYLDYGGSPLNIRAGTGTIGAMTASVVFTTSGTMNVNTLVSSANISSLLITVGTLLGSTINGTNSTITNAVNTAVSTGTLNATTSVSSTALFAINITATNIVATTMSAGTLTGTTINGTNSTITNAVNTALSTGTLTVTTSITTAALFATNVTATNIVGTTISAGTLETSLVDISTTTNVPVNIASTYSAGANGYATSIKSINVNMAANEVVGHNIGQAANTRNSAYFGYCHVASGSTNNYATIGLNSVDRILNINGLGNVGIGTTSPSNKLSVVGSGNTGLIRCYPSTFASETSIGFFQGETSGSSWVMGMSSWGVGPNFAIGYNSNAYATFTTNGNVGIATSSPATTLDVSGTFRATTSITTGLVNATNVTATNVVGTTISAGTLVGTTITGANLSLSGNLVVGGTLTTVNITTTNVVDTNISAGTLTATNINVTTISAGTLVGTLITGGNLSISGTVTAGRLLSTNITATNIVGTTAISSGTILATTRVSSANLNSAAITTGTALVSNSSPELIIENTNYVNNGTSGIKFANTGTASAAAYIRCFLAGLNVHDLQFIGHNGSNNLTAMTIKGSGNIGIGTTVPDYKLQATSTISVTPIPSIGEARYHLYNGGAQAEWKVGQKSSSRHDYCITKVVSGSETDYLSVGVNGNVGIGTTSPSYTLDVTGTCDVSTSITTAALYSTNITATNIVGTTISAGTLALSNANLSSASIGTLVGTLITGGNLSISGTVTVGTLLATTRVSSANLNSSAVSTGTLNATGTMTVGNTLIFNSDPILTVKHNSGSSSVNSGTILLQQANNTGVQLRYEGNTGADMMAIRALTGGVTTGTVVVIKNTGTGIMGINTTSPSCALDISNGTTSSNAPFLRLSNSAGGAGNQVGIRLNPYSGRAGGESSQIIAIDDGASSSHLTFYTAPTGDASISAERMRITADGNIGIGTQTPSASVKLQVLGKVGIGESVITESGRGVLDVKASSIAYSSGTLMSEYALTLSNQSAANGSLGIAFGISNVATMTPGASIIFERTASTNVGLLHFCTRSGALATSPNVIRMTVQTTGNVGIGTTAPASRLTVIGPYGGTNLVTFGDANNNATLDIVSGYRQGSQVAGWTTLDPNGGTSGSTGIFMYDSLHVGGVVTTGSLFVGGSLAKTSGTFDIKHPIVADKRLVHSFIEGPRCDLIYRGRVTLQNGEATVNLDTDCVAEQGSEMTQGTFEALCTNPDYYLQNNSSFDRIRGSISGNILTIICENSSSTDKISWIVVAERKDTSIKEWDRTNSNGFLITEYLS